jgi:superfamily II DNA helicase RecQ
MEKTALIFKELSDKTIVETDNKEIQKRVNNVLSLFQTSIRQKQKTLERCLDKFTVPAYLDAKSKAAIEEETLKHKKREKTSRNSPDKILISKDILHPELYEELRSWRTMLAQEQNVPAYVILSQMALIGITNTLPQTSEQLLQIPGVGKTTLSRYGEELLEIVQESIREYGYYI